MFQTEALTSALVATAHETCLSVGRFELAYPGASCIGHALTVRGTPGDNLALYEALSRAQPGTVILADLDGGTVAGHWGELLTRMAQRQHLAGLVINGSIRDRAEVARLRFPVFFAGTCPFQATKLHHGHFEPVVINGARVSTGDLVVADEDCVLVVSDDEIEAMLVRVQLIRRREREIGEMIDGGASISDAFGVAIGH